MTPTIPKNILRQIPGHWIHRLSQMLIRGFEARVAEYDISIAAWCILISVYDGSAQSINKLAQYIDVDKASVSRVVEKLVKRGLLTHYIEPHRRSGVINLTPKGMEIMPHLLKALEANQRHFFGDLSDADLAVLKRVFRGIFAHGGDISLDGWLKGH